MTGEVGLTARLIGFEWRYHSRQLSFLAGMAIFALFGFVLTTGLGRADVNVNSPALIVEVMALLSLVSVFPLTVFSAGAILRDREHGMEEIVFATAVDKDRFLFTRFAGVLLASLTLMLCAVVGMLVAPVSGMVRGLRVGPTVISHYLEALAIIVLPDILIAAAIVFAIAALTRSAPASYVASVVLYVLYFVAAALTSSPMMAASTSSAGTSMTLASLLDPIGLTAFFEQTRYWTVSQRNETMIALTGSLLANRVIWIGAAVATLAVVRRLYPFRLMPASRSRATPQAEARPTQAVSLRTVEPSPRPLLQLVTVARLELRLLTLNLPFLVLLLTWIAFVVPETLGPVTSGEYGAAFLPMTSLLVSRLWQPLAVFGTVAVIYWSAESLWRERGVGIEPIISSTSVGGTVLCAAKLAALAVMTTAIAFVGAVVCVVIQLLRGGAPIELPVLLAFVALGSSPLVLFAAGCGVIHVLSPNKYAGMVFTFLLAAFMHRGELIGAEHPMLRFAYTPAVSHSDMSGFSGAITPFVWFSAWWALVVATLGWCAAWLWRRHEDDSLARRLRALVADIPRLPTAVLLVATAAVGAFVFVNTNVLGRYETEDELLDWKADYETTWSPHAGDAQPEIADVETQVDLDPDAPALRVRGSYRLVNLTGEPVSRILLSVRRDASEVTLAVDGAAPPAVDERFGMHVFELAEPLAPGASTTARFDLTYVPRGFSPSTPDIGVHCNGSFVMGFLSFPGLGYRTSYEIRDVDERRKRGLPDRGNWTELSEEQPEDTSHASWVTVDATVSTKEGQTVVGPGRLVGRWSEGGRAFFRFRTEERIPNVVAFTSARYDVTKETYHGIDIEVYAHPDHTMMVPAILETTRMSLDTFSEAFGAFPHAHLRIAEVPSSAGFGGFATPGMIILAENRVFSVDTTRDSPIDLVCRRVAHEVAHQWWGHWVVPATVDGGVVLTESLTKYAETLVLEKRRGADQVRNLRAVELDRYFSGRVGEDEPPLQKAGRQPFLYYSKGLLVMGALRDLLGAHAVETALRDLVDAESGPEGNATTAHLIDALHATASPESRQLIDDWMKRVVLYDLAVESAEAVRMPDGRVHVNLRARAARTRVVDGREEPIAMDELIGVAVSDDAGNVLLSEPHRMVSGSNEIRLLVDGEPASVTLDPDILRLDAIRFDNSWKLELDDR